MAGTYARYSSIGGGGGGGGITSINGDTTAAQVIASGTGISVSTSSGTTTITNTGGTVTSVSVVSTNGFAGTVATPTTTPAITVSTSITGILYGNGTSVSAGNASLLPYTPSTPGDWSPVPTTTGGALDELASELAAGTFVPYTGADTTVNLGSQSLIAGTGTFNSGLVVSDVLELTGHSAELLLSNMTGQTNINFADHGMIQSLMESAYVAVYGSPNGAAMIVNGSTSTEESLPAGVLFFTGLGQPNLSLTIDQTGLVTIGPSGFVGTHIVNGSLSISKALIASAFQLTTAPTSGYVLTSDSAGNGTWQASGSPSLPLSVANGGTGRSTVATIPVANTLAGWNSSLALEADSFNAFPVPTTFGGSAGEMVAAMPFQGGSYYQKVIIYLSGFTDTGTQVYTFPTAFARTPYVYGLTAGVAAATVSTTTVSFTGTTLTGFVFLEGY